MTQRPNHKNTHLICDLSNIFFFVFEIPGRAGLVEFRVRTEDLSQEIYRFAEYKDPNNLQKAKLKIKHIKFKGRNFSLQ